MDSSSSSLPLSELFSVRSMFVLGLILAVIWKLFRDPTGGHKQLPPGPRRWPILGNIPSMIWSRGRRHHAHAVFGDWAREYGGVMAVGLNPGQAAPTVILSDIHCAKEALLKQADCFSDRYVTPMTEHLFTVKGSFIWESGDAAKENRRFGQSALRTLGVGKRKLEHKINEEARFLVDCFEAEGNGPFNPLLHVHNAVSNIICTVSFGHRFDYDDRRFTEMLNVMKSIFEAAGIGAIGNVFPSLLFTRLYSDLRGWVNSLNDFMVGIVEEHRQSYDPNDLRDFVDLHIAEFNQCPLGETDGAIHGTSSASTDWLIARGLKDLFGAGTDTTSTTLLWILMCALVYPETQEKIQKEINDVIGSGRQPSCDDRASMPYTHAFILEVQRWRPATPFAVPYTTSGEARVRGYTIPKGTVVLVNLWAVMNDPATWDEPEQFNPGRFLTEDGQKVINHEAFIPFGLGRRSCLGEGLAKMELFLFVTNLFQRVTFKLPAGTPLPSTVGTSGITLVPDPFKLCAVKR